MSHHPEFGQRWHGGAYVSTVPALLRWPPRARRQRLRWVLSDTWQHYSAGLYTQRIYLPIPWACWRDRGLWVGIAALWTPIVWEDRWT